MKRKLLRVLWIDAPAVSLAVIYAAVLLVTKLPSLAAAAITLVAGVLLVGTHEGDFPFNFRALSWKGLGLALFFLGLFIVIYSCVLHFVFPSVERPVSLVAAIFGVIATFCSFGTEAREKWYLSLSPTEARLTKSEETFYLQLVAAALFIYFLNRAVV